MRVGTVAGFELRIHWSTAVIFGLVVWSLASVQLPDQAPEASDTARLVAALVGGVAFYAGLLAHELSHAIAARREGLEVDSLTLWLLGGVAALRGEPSTPGADFRIAGIGPAVSLAIAAIGGTAAVVLDAIGAPAIVVATAAWLGGINLLLAIFNLIPAAPLDGGRLLRAAIWARRKDRTVAAVTAARAGEAFGYLLIGFGVLGLFAPGLGGGLWFIILGWFLTNAARAEQTQAQLQDALGDVRVAEVMTPQPVSVPADATVATVLERYVLATRHSAFPIVDDDGRPAGLITLDRIRSVPPDRREATRAVDVACPMEEVVAVAPEERLLDLIPRLNACGDGRALVIENDRIVGLVSARDVARSVELARMQSPIHG